MLVVSAISVLAVLCLKELFAMRPRTARIANYLYLPAIPLIILFAIAAYQKTIQIPSLTG